MEKQIANRVMSYILSGCKELPPEGVIDERFMAFERGRKMRRDGKPCPPKPSDDCDGTELHAALWIGYRVELNDEHSKKCAAADLLGAPHPPFKE